MLLVVVTSCLATACLNIEGVHVLHPYGESDTGGYRIAMSDATYLLLSGNGGVNDMLSQLRRFSRPSTRFYEGGVSIEDLSSSATMERMYDTYQCQAAPSQGFMDCHFALAIDRGGEMPGWSIDWDVVLQPGMRIVASNHHRTRRVNNQDHLMWYFDGNRVSSANIDFTIRVPRVS
jgi:hypothetical protein